jgi:dihydrofolate reductase
MTRTIDLKKSDRAVSNPASPIRRENEPDCSGVFENRRRTMRKIVAAAYLSLDGVMQAPGGPDEDPTGGFQYGGWVAPHWGDELTRAMNEQFSAPFDLLLGRRTYDIFAAHWPHVEADPAASDFDALNVNIAQTFNRITKYVATHHPQTLGWQNSEALGSDAIGRLRQLKREEGPILLTQGSTDLLQQLLAAELVESEATSNGVIMATYERAGEVKTGSFEFEAPTEAELERRRNLR